MSMPRCPNCYYGLVLLEERHKYKCALCSKLYRQKDIEDKEFRQWNQWQRQLDTVHIESDLKRHEAWLKEQKRALKSLFSPPFDRRQRWQAYYYMHREKELERYSNYNDTHRDQRTLTYRNWVAKNKEHRQSYEKAYASVNKAKDLQKKRLAYWRRKQKVLAGHYLENSKYTPEEVRLYPFSPTFAPCDLLEEIG